MSVLLMLLLAFIYIVAYTVVMQRHNGLSPYCGQDLLARDYSYQHFDKAFLTAVTSVFVFFFLRRKQHNSVYFIMFSYFIFWSLFYLSPPPSQSRHTVALKNGIILFCGCQLFSLFINFNFTYSYFGYEWSTSLDSQNKISFLFCVYVCIAKFLQVIGTHISKISRLTCFVIQVLQRFMLSGTVGVQNAKPVTKLYRILLQIWF